MTQFAILKMSVGQLQAEYERRTGNKQKSRNKGYLQRLIANLGPEGEASRAASETERATPDESQEQCTESGGEAQTTEASGDDNDSATEAEPKENDVTTKSEKNETANGENGVSKPAKRKKAQARKTKQPKAGKKVAPRAKGKAIKSTTKASGANGKAKGAKEREDSPATRLIKKLHGEGKSLREIVTTLESKGMQTSRGSKKWWPSSIQSALGQRWDKKEGR